MNKAGSIFLVIVFVALAYLFLTVFMPLINETVTTSGEQIELSPYADNYTGATEGLQMMPLICYFIPGVGGVVAVVVILKH